MKRVLLIDYDHDELVIVKSTIVSTDLAEIVGESTSYSLIPSLVNRHRPDFVFITVRNEIQETLSSIKKIREINNTCQIVILGDHSDADEILQCFRAGANEFLIKPMKKDELIQVFERLGQTTQTNRPDELEPSGKVLAVWGSRGGCGTTSFAVNIAHRLAEKHDTVLVDFHFGQGDLYVYMDVRPSLTLADLAESSDRIDDTLIDSIITKHKSGMHLLLQSFEYDMQQLQHEEIQKILRILQQKYTYIIIDLGNRLDIPIHFASSIQHFYLLMKQDLPSLFLAKSKLEHLAQMEVATNNISIVVNAFSKKNSVTLNHISKVLKRSDLLFIREDPDNMLASINRGVPVHDVSRWSKAGKDYFKLSEKILACETNKRTLDTSDATQGIRLKPLSVVSQPFQNL